MARNKKSAAGEGSEGGGGGGGGRSESRGGGGGGVESGGSVGSGSRPSTSALIICRNKHWRYISSFHGPWLQLPPEVLTSLAHTNWLSPRPRAIDPAVLYDLVAIRTAVDEATNLAVRAASGLTAAALGNNLLGGHGGGHGGHGHGHGTHGHGHGPPQAKLSRERKHRMRELATTKLSQAYHVDEIAASVATMQSASTLEDVAQLVLQRDPSHVDARYVHFFHEKIPSRMLAQSTPLDALDHVVAERPDSPAPLRTRALTRLFTHDYPAAARDLTAALATARHAAATAAAANTDAHHHANQPNQPSHHPTQHTQPPQPPQPPSSLEPQLLFHRAGVYFALAHRHVNAALDGPAHPEAARQRAAARQQVRQNAKRAIRDYTAFLAHLDYAPTRSVHPAPSPVPTSTPLPPRNRLLESTTTSSSSSSSSSSLPQPQPLSNAVVPHRHNSPSLSPSISPSPLTSSSLWPTHPTPHVLTVSSLFSPLPPASLPPYPPPPSSSTISTVTRSFVESHETLTYHPLLTDALHSLLLCHALVQTPPKEHLRHAHNAARLTRICDGYPIFLAARSPARADWTEVLRRAGNWIGITTTWDHLCRPPSPPGHPHAATSASTQLAKTGTNTTTTPTGPTPETPTQKRDRQKHEAILEALADERVVDEDSFQRAVRARERRFQMDEEIDDQSSALTCLSTSSNSSSQPPPPPKRWAQDDAREYPISTDRAEAIARWVREAPPVVMGEGGARKKRTKGKGKRDEKRSEQVLVASVEGLELEAGEEEEEADE